MRHIPRRPAAVLAAALAVAAVAAAPALADTPPANTAPPAVSGLEVEGQVLTAQSGSWTGSPTPAFSYGWQRCNASGSACADVAGATSQTYQLVTADVGHTLRVRVTATNTAGAAEALSGPSAVVAAKSPPANTAAPTVSGTAQVGQTLTADPGSWSGTPAPTFAYQWQRCDAAGASCASIGGATGKTYVLVAADAGGRLQVVVTATNSSGSVSKTSAQTAVVWTVPANTSAPTVSGTAAVGQALTASPGTWTGSPAPTFSYAWKRCDSAGNACGTISGATGATYAVTSSDAGHRLRVTVAASNAAGSASATSAASAVVPSSTAPSNTSRPAISGQQVVGRTLTASTGAWTGTPPITFWFTWQRCSSSGTGCATIPGAAAQTYLLVAADAGQRLQVIVGANNPVGSRSATSAQTGVIASPPVVVTPPSLGGVAREGETVWVAAGSWTGSTPITYAYQWLRCDTAGASCQTIGSATGQTYLVTAADVGYRLQAAVTARNGYGTTVHSTSVSAVVVGNTAPPRYSVLPYVVGTAATGSTVRASDAGWTGVPTPTVTFQWLRCGSAGGSCVVVPGATADAYTLTAADAGRTVRVRVTARNVAGSAEVTSAPSATIAGPPTTIPAVATVARRTVRLGDGTSLRVSVLRVRLRAPGRVGLRLAVDRRTADGWRRVGIGYVADGPATTLQLVSLRVAPARHSAATRATWASGRVSRTVHFVASAHGLRRVG